MISTKSIRRTAAAATVLLAAAVGAHADAIEPAKSGPDFFISIDGLQPTLLQTLSERGVLDAAGGLGALRREASIVERVMPVVTTLTAASHISTVTCSTPAKHGVIANSFMAGGARINGFSAPFATEPLWRAAMRQGKTVLTLAYVGADGTAPERTSTWGLGYPSDRQMGASQNLSWEIATLPVAAGWTIPADVRRDGLSKAEDWRETSIEITLNPLTNEKRTVNALIKLVAGLPQWIRIDDDKDLANGYFGTLRPETDMAARVDVFFIESDAASELSGFKRRAFIRVMPDADGRLGLYVSKASYNNAYPAEFRQRLDDANLVWPDYGVRSDKLSLPEYIETQSMIDVFLTDVAAAAVPTLNPDLVIYYNPLIDSVGHKLQASLPLPFDPDHDDDVTQAFVSAFRVVDQNIARLTALGGVDSVMALMGDHGMDASRKVVNLAALLPAEHADKVQVVTSGALAMLYDAPGEDNVGAARAFGEALRSRLQTTVLDDGAVTLGEAFEQDAATAWNYGEATWAFTAASGIWWTYNPLNHDVLLDPPALGMHGQSTATASMATTLLVRAPGLGQRKIATGSLLDAVPTFTRLIGIEPPANCEGHPLF